MQITSSAEFPLLLWVSCKASCSGCLAYGFLVRYACTKKRGIYGFAFRRVFEQDQQPSVKVHFAWCSVWGMGSVFLYVFMYFHDLAGGRKQKSREER